MIVNVADETACLRNRLDSGQCETHKLCKGFVKKDRTETDSGKKICNDFSKDAVLCFLNSVNNHYLLEKDPI
jgi:hypothetical protein